MSDDDLDELLSKLERRADRLSAPASKNVRESDSFGRLSSAIGKKEIAGRPKPGDAIGESYEVEEVIGHTDTSTVLKVRHRGVERHFAMKLLPHELATDDERVERFQDEARATSMIGHENIVFVTDFGRSNRFGLFYVMEYLNGPTLAERLKGGAQEIEDALNVCLCAGSALAAVHELGIVHRDVRPGNLMSHTADGEETWKLFDFGVSSQVVGADEALGLYGEPLYVAPEQASGAEVDARADQFALAAVLVHVLCGRPPWPRRTWTTATTQSWTAPRLDELKKDSRYLHRVLMRALAVEPADRFDDIESFVAAFQRASGRSRRPTIPPIDLQEAARAVAGQYASASVTIGTTFESEVSEVSEAEVQELGDPPSVEISVDMLADARTEVVMDFQHANRLRREWRRNLVSGGIFIPTERTIAAGTSIVVTIRFSPTGDEESFPGHVMEAGDEADPRGLAVEIEPGLRDRLHAFLYGLNLGLLKPSAVVRPKVDVSESSDFTADEAFLMTRLTKPTAVGRLRSAFASLPIDFEEILDQLLEKDYVEIVGGKRRRSRSQAGGGGKKKSETSQQRHFVRMTLERADYFRSQGNFLAEIETLELASERVEEPEFHYRAGLSRVQFQNDFDGAIASMRRAVELAPGVERYTKALAELERLKGD
jgi:serine/threonine protein kinase